MRTVEARALDRMAAIRPADWDRLVPDGRGHVRHRFLAACEQVELKGFVSRPLIVERSGFEHPIAVAPAYFYDLDLALFAQNLVGRAIAEFRRLVPRALLLRVLELGCPAALGEPFCADREVNEREAIASMVEQALLEARDASAQLVVIRDFETGGGAAAEVLSRFGFAPIPLPPTFVLKLGFPSFEAYLSAMRSAYRRRARLRLEKAGELSVDHLAEFAPLADELAHLWRLVYDRAHEYKREVLPKGFFEAASAVPETSILALRRSDGSIASFALLLEDRPWLRFLYSGFEAEAARREGAYFRLLYEIVRYGIEGGFEQIELGITTAEPKLDLGARPVYLEAWIRHRRRANQRLLTALMRGPLAPKTAEPRKVFQH